MILLYVSSTTVAYGKKNENIKRYLDLNDQELQHLTSRMVCISNQSTTNELFK